MVGNRPAGPVSFQLYLEVTALVEIPNAQID